MADWVHCNLCFRQPGDGKRFSITNCGHIYCESCVGPGTQPKCRMCGSKCCTTVLSPKMKPDVDIFFCDPKDIVKRQHEQLMKVLDFQRNQRQRLILYTKDKLQKQAAMLQKAQKAVEQHNKLTQENMVLKAENAYLRKSGGGRTPSPSSHGRSQSAPRQSTTPSPNLYRQMTYGSNITSGRLTTKTPPAPRTSPASHRHQGGISPNQSMDCSPAAASAGRRLSSMPQQQMSLPITPGTGVAPSGMPPHSANGGMRANHSVSVPRM